MNYILLVNGRYQRVESGASSSHVHQINVQGLCMGSKRALHKKSCNADRADEWKIYHVADDREAMVVL